MRAENISGPTWTWLSEKNTWCKNSWMACMRMSPLANQGRIQALHLNDIQWSHGWPLLMPEHQQWHTASVPTIRWEAELLQPLKSSSQHWPEFGSKARKLVRLQAGYKACLLGEANIPDPGLLPLCHSAALHCPQSKKLPCQKSHVALINSNGPECQHWSRKLFGTPKLLPLYTIWIPSGTTVAEAPGVHHQEGKEWCLAMEWQQPLLTTGGQHSNHGCWPHQGRSHTITTIILGRWHWQWHHHHHPPMAQPFAAQLPQPLTGDTCRGLSHWG